MKVPIRRNTISIEKKENEMNGLKKDQYKDEVWERIKMMEDQRKFYSKLLYPMKEFGYIVYYRYILKKRWIKKNKS